MPSDSRSSGVGSGFRNPLITSADIPDGSITTTKLANLAVTTAKIADASITNAKIANLAVTNAKIQSISASKITAGTISAQTITMGAGGLIQLSDGEIRTSTGTTYISLSGAGVADRLRFVRGGSVVARIHNVTSGDLEIAANRDISIVPARHLNLISEGNLVLESISGSVSTPGVFNVGSWITLPNGTRSNPAIRFLNDTDLGIYRSGADTLGIVGYFHAGFVQGGEWQFTLNTSGQIRSAAIRDVTTGAAANVFINSSNGLMARSTSSARYKTDLRPWDRSASVLDLEPTLFRSRIETDDRRVRLGLIAEQVAERFPIAAVYDDAGRPDAIDWNAIVAGLIAEVQTLRASIANLDPS